MAKLGINTLGKVVGHVDGPLIDEGIRQVEEIREKLLNVPIDLIISSPLRRAIETAEIINRNRNIPILIDERARERNLGIYEEISPNEEKFNEIRYYSKNVAVPSGEDSHTFTKRVFEFLDDVIKEHKGDKDTILIVTHGMFLRSVSWYFKGFPNDDEIIHRVENCQMDEYEV